MKKPSTTWLLAMLCWLPLLAMAQIDPTHVYKIVSRADTRCIEISGVGNSYHSGSFITQADYVGGANQQWRLLPVSAGSNVYFIQSRNSKLNMGLHDIYAQNHGLYGSYAVEQQTNDGGTQQQWRVTTNARGATVITSVFCGNKFYATTDGQNTTCNGTPGSDPNWAEWDIVDVTNNVQGGVFQIINDYSNKALTSSPDGGNNVGQMTPWGLACEEWTFSLYNGGPNFIITNRKTQQVLEMGGGGDENRPGNVADIWGYWGGAKQQWLLRAVSDNRVLNFSEVVAGTSFYATCVSSNLILSVGGNAWSGELRNEGQYVQQWYYYNWPWQQWHAQYNAANRIAAPSVTPVTIKAPTHTAQLYPNPAHNLLTLSVDGSLETSSVRVTDALGRAVSVPYRNGQLNVADLAPGIYLVSFTDGQHTYREKFSKE